MRRYWKALVAVLFFPFSIIKWILDQVGRAQTVRDIPILAWILSPYFSPVVFSVAVIMGFWAWYDVRVKKDQAGFLAVTGNKRRFKKQAVFGVAITLFLFIVTPLGYGYYHRHHAKAPQMDAGHPAPQPTAPTPQPKEPEPGVHPIPPAKVTAKNTEPSHTVVLPSLSAKNQSPKTPSQSPNTTTETYSTKDSAHADAQHVGTKDDASAVVGTATETHAGPIGLYNAEGGKASLTCSVINAPNGKAIENHGDVLADHLSINAPPSCTPSQKKIGTINVLLTETAEPSFIGNPSKEGDWAWFSTRVLSGEFDEQVAKDFAAQPDTGKKIEFLKKLKESLNP